MRKSRDTWSNRQVWPSSTKWSRVKGNKRTCWSWQTPLPRIQETTLYMNISRWSIPKSELIVFFAAEDGDGSDHWLLIAKVRLKLKNAGKTTRPFRYDLNQMPYNFTVEVTNRFKGLDMIECLKNYGWRFVQEAVIKIIPKKNKCKKAKWLSEEA